MEKDELVERQIFNIDKPGIYTVYKPAEGRKHAGAAISLERGKNVTLEICALLEHYAA